ncbi:MAG: cytochrome c biogenesis CcdA family protein [Brevibacterium aurantiacum]|uniref:Cytochrome c biogenesis protein CcdA n=1 Tax=Brevibacterium aurantiacum TaxID=273384 RepID=A0A2A3ZIC3_BREAU|nr:MULTISPECIES: cytochrome c biogenesis CcdA family protein [Brevibacterium]MDN5594396.1 cytochrome c biogenesis CcdA family protein [Brevibacterium sp.]AZL06772.1 cytochrome c biogenesis protein CcdA [Brevibacterium aurantiacum]MDN5608517.1 cytochrome c biogenesis CcdA family protein [Brevibacterium sp.]PCC17559.1 cytochrome c biogenesis protein CcdA [Brevibacterium aurantiacum]PCC45205.1 cytochrome c biogenesis protein CcdA [Brevibacterium aurantiacum]
MDIGLLSAFIGGVLALLSPCAALLLPAFFGSTVGVGSRLLLHGGIFYVGMLLVLIPLGMGAGTLGALFTAYRGTIVLVASAILIILGIVQFFGFGFDPAKALPGADAMRSKSATATGATKTFLLGATSGIAGVCSGPILGAVLTLAATRGSVFLGGVMLAIYGAGMVVPLFITAALWSRMGPRARAVMRGGSVTLFGRRLPVVSMVTGALMILIGIVFWMTNGLVSAPSLVSTSTLAHIQEWASSWTTTTIDILVVCLLALIAIALWFRHERRRNQGRPDKDRRDQDIQTRDEPRH